MKGDCGFKRTVDVYFSEYDTETNMEYFKDIQAYNDPSKKKICYISHAEFEDMGCDHFTDNDINSKGIGYHRDNFEEIVYDHIEFVADDLNALPAFHGQYKAEFIRYYAENLFMSLQGETPETRLNEAGEDDILKEFLCWFGDYQK